MTTKLKNEIDEIENQTRQIKQIREDIIDIFKDLK